MATMVLSGMVSCGNRNECEIKTETVVLTDNPIPVLKDEQAPELSARDEGIMKELGKECKPGRVYAVEKICYTEITDELLWGFIPYHKEQRHCDIHTLKDICSIEELLIPLKENDTVFEKFKEGYVIHFPENTGMPDQWLTFVIDLNANPKLGIYQCPMKLDTVVGNRYGIYNTALNLEQGGTMTFFTSVPHHNKAGLIRSL
jgi:hypothetical protein